MTRLRLLDLYCGEGGAAVGYARAGFDVTGVDVRPTAGRYYPFAFVCADAIEYAKQHAHEFDVVHASPPCQRHTQGNAATKTDGHGVRAARRRRDWIGVTRDVLLSVDKPYVIENVPLAPLLDPLVLCGTQFYLTTRDDDGTLLHLKRHRLFESNVVLDAPVLPCVHPRSVQWAGVYDGARHDKHDARHIRQGGYVPRSRAVQARLLGVDWTMTQQGLFDAIPPAYTEHIGRQLGGAL